jgi:cellulose synthase (UDP-forming)
MISADPTLGGVLAFGAFALGAPRRWLARPAAQAALVAGLALIVARYLHWRVVETVLPARTLDAETLFIWALFAVELLAWFDAAVMFAALLRRTDRSAEADRHEARLRAGPPSALPSVDVFIATYNEPPEVLERTLVGALALDWPAERLKIWVLDDGGRAWLRDLCAEKGAGYLTRPDNSHAKAGNINAALRRTEGAFFMVLDADFVPRTDFLRRTMGFFEDPSIGIVQVPHGFFNRDPMQTNLDMRRTLPDDQRLFFEAIMPGRDGWDCAFCCGSNAVTRRAAIEAAGGGLPTGSITEDMLLTLVLLRHGYKTRYLDERLAVGLAPESLQAFFVQRARWARGALQILYLRDGPLGPGLRLRERILFLPTHWLSQALSQTAAMSVPAIYLWTGLAPLAEVSAAGVLGYQLPAIVGAIGVAHLLAPREFHPLAATAHATLQALRLLPVVASTLAKPFGHAFRVTPKGADAGGGAVTDRPTLYAAVGLMLATAFGLLINASYNLEIVDNTTLTPIVAFWATANMTVLLVVASMATSPPRLRQEERFELDEPCRVILRENGRLRMAGGRVLDLSLSGIRLKLEAKGANAAPFEPGEGDWLLVDLEGVGPLPACIRRRSGDGLLGARLHLPPSAARDALIRRLFASGLDNSVRRAQPWRILMAMLAHSLRGAEGAGKPAPDTARPAGPPPDWATRLFAPSAGAGPRQPAGTLAAGPSGGVSPASGPTGPRVQAPGGATPLARRRRRGSSRGP